MDKNRTIPQMFSSSARSLRSVRGITLAAALIALQVVLSQATVTVTDSLHITFDRCVLSMTASVLGPVVGMAAGAISDLLQCLLHGWAPNPGLTVNEMLVGLLYGLFLYRRFADTRSSLLPIILCQIIVCLAVNVLLGTLWLSLWYGSPFVSQLVPRLVKNLVSLPCDVLLVWLMQILRRQLEKSGALRRS